MRCCSSRSRGENGRSNAVEVGGLGSFDDAFVGVVWCGVVIFGKVAVDVCTAAMADSKYCNIWGGK